MSDTELKKFLSGVSAVPECPTDKFVAAFVSQMDADKTPVRNPSFSWGYGAIAASLVAAFGIYFAMQNGLITPKANQNLVVASNANTQSDADTFAAQLISADLIEETPVSGDL